MIATVVTSSFATRWLGTWLPAGWTTRWYTAAWNEFQLGDVLIVTFEVVGARRAVLAACSACRRPTRWPGASFRGKRFVMLLFLLPLLVPPITYGIPLATVLYQIGPRRHDLRASSSPTWCRRCRS